MSGLSEIEVKELIEYIKENNSWERLYSCIKKGRRVFKYYTMAFDTRTNDMWRIEFHQISGEKNDKTVICSTDQGYDLKTKIYEWLDENVCYK